MDEGCFWLVGILVLIAIVIAVAVYVILPVTLFVIGGIALAGTASGVYVAGQNFVELMIESHKVVK